VLNADGLRYDDEFVKHKILDAIGDMYVAGHPLLAAYTAFKVGPRHEQPAAARPDGAARRLGDRDLRRRGQGTARHGRAGPRLVVTNQPHWRQWAMLSLRWAVVLGLCVIGLFVLRRAAVFV
jgi:hypothetical protein